ncbi:conserved hypothetical protein [Vibrio phage 137E35-1]|nr:conserved hypothetical protein [Vibrio phage 137E35-1]CAH9016612.1 conserved hypothetical protein [Vibrio phage 230E39-1]
MKKKQFYIDVDKASRLGLIPYVRVSLNGKRIHKVIAAKHGVNGFVEYYDNDPKINFAKYELITHKARGNVKISIHKPNTCGNVRIEPEEGGKCPECKNGELTYHAENCTCHINPPCGYCIDAPLTCNHCGAEFEE